MGSLLNFPHFWYVKLTFPVRRGTFCVVISGLADGMLFVFDCFGWAAADACHTMCTVFTIYGFAVAKLYIVERAELFALSAANALISGIKALCFYNAFIKQWI